MEHIALIITSFFGLVGTLVAGWFAYNQKNKDRMAELKFEQIKKTNDEKLAVNNRQIAVVYGEMWNLLHRLNVDRVFIIQPHPEMKYLYLSVLLEVDKNGVSLVKDIFQNIPMSDMAGGVVTAVFIIWFGIM